MSISLKKAYRACLWLAEHKIGVPVNERQGQCDLTKENDEEFSWQRSDLVAALPLEYYENSIYSYDCGDGIICIDASNIIDGPLFTDEIESTFERFSPNRNREFFHPARDEIKPADKPQNIEKLVKLSLPMCKFDDEKEPQVENVNKTTLASLMAHNTLIDLLKKQVVKARCATAVLQIPDLIKNSNAWDDCDQLIPASFWSENPIPNYEHSAVEQGISRLLRMIKHFDGDLPDESFINQCEFWYKSITISDNFESWLMERVREIYPTPETATFKLEDGKYLIQYGTDKAVKIKVSKGLTLIHKIMSAYNRKEYNETYTGLTPEIFNREQSDSDILDYESDTRTKQKNPTKLKKYIRNQQNRIYSDLCTKYECMAKSHYDKAGDNDNHLLEILTKKIEYRVNKVKKKDSEYQNVASILEYIDTTVENFSANQKTVKVLLKVEFDDDEREFDKLRKNIENAIIVLTEVVPHLAKHIGTLKSEGKQGIGYENNEFYYISNGKTKWNFK